MNETGDKKEEIAFSRTEEVRDIVDRMPTTFAKYITYVVCGIVVLLLFFGYIVKYPDIVTGEVAISAELAPLQLVAEHNGRLRLSSIKSQDSIAAGQLLAWIDNPADPERIVQIDSLMGSIALPTANAGAVYRALPKDLNLGDLTVPYSALLSALKQLADYQDNRLYDKQDATLGQVLQEQRVALETLIEKEQLSLENMKLTDKFLERDSILFHKKIISQQEFEQSMASRLTAEDQVKTSLRNSGSIREQISNTENAIQQNRITKSEKQLQLDLELLSSYNNLLDKINSWKKQYLITSPIPGKVQFLKFWNDNQFVQAGEPIFSIVPEENEALGKVFLPVQGAGKVKKGQEVIVKLADFPYMEYGYIKGRIQGISMVSSPMNVGNGHVMDTYMVTVVFEDGLTTNYETTLDFKYETKGTAEVITKDRRLIERFFDNLKYIGHSK